MVFGALAIIYLLLPVTNVIFTKCNAEISKYVFFLVALFTMENDLIVRIALTLQAYSGMELLEFSSLLPKLNIFSSWDAFSLVYFMMGGFLHKQNGKQIIPQKNIGIISICFITIAVYGMWYMRTYNAYYDIIWNSYPNILMLIMTSLIVGLQINQKPTKAQWIANVSAHISKNSMGIYFFHLLIGTLMKPWYLSLTYSKVLVSGLLYAIIVFCLSDIACSLIKKVPFMRKVVSL